MPSSYSTSLRFNLQATGEGLNSWGNVLNTGALSLIDSSIAGYTAISLTANTTLTTANGSADQARMATLKFTSTGAYTVTIPAVSKQYFIWNASSYNITIASSGGGTSVIVPATGKVYLGSDGTNVFELGYSGYGLKDYIDQAVLAATGSLPAVTGNAGKYLYCDGVTWLPRTPVLTDNSDYNSYTASQTGKALVFALIF